MISTRILAVAGAAAVLVGLAACAPPHPAVSSTTTIHHATPAAKPSSSASRTAVPSPGATAIAIGPSGNALDAAGVQDIHDSISSGNTAALEQRFAPQVRVVTTEGEDERVTADQAVEATDAVESDLTATWNWSPSSAALAGFRATTYAPLFPSDAVVGQSSTGEVISFTIVGTAITAVLMADSVASLSR